MGQLHVIFGDVAEVRKGKDNLLPKAMKKLNRFILKHYSDDQGLVAFEVDEYLVVAKKYALRGIIVSAHTNAVLQAKELGKDLLMYIGEWDKFYAFHPQDIIDNGTRNTRGKSVFLNFDIKLGRESDV
jgi:hypothetical protein